MVTFNDLRTELDGVINEVGVPIRLRYYSFAYSGTEYDSVAYLTQSGTDVWVSGVIFPVGGKTSSDDWKLMEQGRLTFNDSKLYINGSVNLTPVSGVIKLGVGSPTNTNQYYITDNGVQTQSIGGSFVYNKCYIRILNNGSFANQI